MAEQRRPLNHQTGAAGGPPPAAAWRWDLVGLPWTEAEQILQARGLTYECVVTAPPNRPVGTGELRVVAERRRFGTLQVVLAYREYQREEP